MNGITLLFFAILAAAGAFVTVAALAQPSAEPEVATDLQPAGFVIHSGRPQPAGLRATLAPHFGQVSAFELTSLPHSLHLISAIESPSVALQ